MTSPRPKGITILAILAIAGGGVVTLMGLVNLGFAIVLLENLKPEGLGPAATAVNSDHLLVVLGIVNIIVGIVNLLFGLGSLSLKMWAWLLGIVLQILGIAAIFASLFTGRMNIILAVILLVVYGAILYYLFQSQVRQAFNQKGEG